MDQEQRQTLFEQIKAVQKERDYQQVLALVADLLPVIVEDTRDDTLEMYGQVLRIKGDALRLTNQYEEALAVYQTAIPLLAADSEDLVDILYRQAILYRNLRQMDEARRALHQASQLAETLQYQVGLMNVAREQSTLARFQGDLPLAIEYGHVALGYAEKLGRGDELSAVWTLIALVYHDEGRLDKAIHGYKQALAYGRHGRAQSVGIWLSNLGECYQDLFAMEEARQYHQEALDHVLALSEEQGRVRRETGDIYRNLGLDLFYLGEVEAGRAHIVEALKVLDIVDDVDVRMQVLFTLSFVDLQQGAIEEGYATAQKLFALATELKANWHLTRAHYLLGVGQAARGEGDLAQASWQQAQFMAHDTSQHYLLWRVHAALGDTSPNEALAGVHYQIAAATIQQIIDPIQDEELRASFLEAAEVKEVLLKAGG